MLNNFLSVHGRKVVFSQELIAARPVCLQPRVYLTCWGAVRSRGGGPSHYTAPPVP